ncbi:FMN adenylyltransferase [Pseudorhodoferax sp.]|uniref:FMN adenylyltransferase n=1 Tax=Pseudorhodoferax sp. TaxID=1993553 RepID=UPI002DD65F18|nr:FMN adenylyltransferase [Pseudorhodoferax sp.]
MQTIASDQPFALAASVATIGVFDGVHRGHRQLLARLREAAGRHGVPSVVVTFDPHPRAVLAPQAAPALLGSLQDRLALLRASGDVDVVLVLRFDAVRARQSADDFVDTVLLQQLRVRQLVLGADFRFGHGRSGSVAALAEHGRRQGFGVCGVTLLADGSADAGTHCSSTLVRSRLAAGDVGSAAALLGRPHCVTGWLRPGAGAGRSADMAVAGELCVPPAGLYAGHLSEAAPGASAPWQPVALQVHARDASGRQRIAVYGHGSLARHAHRRVALHFAGPAASLQQAA